MRQIIIHHSLTKDGPLKDFDAIRRYHIETNGWRDIGYHFVLENVEGHLQLFGGRPIHEQGAHTRGHNEDIGICLVGDFDAEPPDPALIRRLFNIVFGLLIMYNLQPDAVKYHSDYDPKSCPGEKFPKEKFKKHIAAAFKRCQIGG